jgi:hypothetical protein
MMKDSKHIARVKALGCVVCRNNGYDTDGAQADAHHIGNGAMGKKASDYEVIPLCKTHHQYSAHGEIAVHDGRKSFEARYGTERELLEQTMGDLDEYQ